MTELIANTAPNSPRRRGLCSRVVTSATMDRTLTKVPAAPTPANARPKINTSTVGATPHSKLPISKTQIAKRKVHFLSNTVNAWP